jgi:hypothetical protein
MATTGAKVMQWNHRLKGPRISRKRCCWSFKGDIGIKEQDPDGATGTKVMQELQVQGLAGTDGAVDLKGIGEAGFTRLQLVLREQMG